MRKLAARVVAVALGATVACATAVAAALLLPGNPLRPYLLYAKCQVFPDQEDRLRTEAPSRNRQVLLEIAELSDHAWAGTYRTIGTWPVVLSIAPAAGYTLYEAAPCGNCAGYVGAGRVVAVNGSTLSLQVDLARKDDTSSAWFGVDETLHLVRWGDLLFAVPQSRMERFCAEASDGNTFPYVPFRCVGRGAAFDFEDPPRPQGLPVVPSEFEHLILKQPISGHILALAEWRRRPELDGNDVKAYDAVYSVDVGTADGLAVGMRLFVECERPQRRFDGRVEVVEAHAARFQVLAFGDKREWARGLVGKGVSTERPKPDDR